MNSCFLQPQIILLREGTESHQGKPHLISNVNACEAIVDAIRTTLGPRGMDKLILDSSGKTTISNDGATIMKKLDIVHPAAKTLVDIAKSQDAEVSKSYTLNVYYETFLNFDVMRVSIMVGCFCCSSHCIEIYALQFNADGNKIAILLILP